MRKIFAALLLLSLAVPYAQAEMKWSGGSGLRYLRLDNDDGLATKNAAGKDSSKSYDRRWNFRANIGVGNTSEHVDWNVALRTAGSAKSEWVSFQNGTDLGFNLEQANARLHTNEWWESDWALVIGRQKMGLLYDSVGQALFSKNVRWDGLSFNWKKSGFGFNAAQYVLGATNRGTALQPSAYTSTEATQAVATTRSSFALVQGFQPTYEWKVSEDIKAQFAVGYYVWSGTGGGTTPGFTNNVHGGTAGTVGNINPVIMDNARQLQLLTDWILPANFRFVGEYIRNKKTAYGTMGTLTAMQAKRDGYALSVIYGAAKKKGDWSLFYTFSDRGVASSVNTFSNADATADNISHMFEGKYMLADNLALGGKLQYHKEKGRVGGDGLAIATPNEKRLQKQRRIELYSAISF